METDIQAIELMLLLVIAGSVLYVIYLFVRFFKSLPYHETTEHNHTQQKPRSNSFENITSCGLSIDQLIQNQTNNMEFVPQIENTYSEGKVTLALAVFQALHSQLFTHTQYYTENRNKIEAFSAKCVSVFQASKLVDVLDKVWQKLAVLGNHGGRIAVVIKQVTTKKTGTPHTKTNHCYLDCLLKDTEEPGEDNQLKILAYTTGTVVFEEREMFVIIGGSLSGYTLRYKDGMLYVKVESGEDSNMYSVNSKIRCNGFITE